MCINAHVIYNPTQLCSINLWCNQGYLVELGIKPLSPMAHMYLALGVHATALGYIRETLIHRNY